MDFVIDFYRTEKGESPIECFLESLDMKMRTKALRVISMLKTYGNALREPYSKPLKEGIFELRVSLGSDIIRLLYFFRRPIGHFDKWICKKDTKDSFKRNRDCAEI